MKRIIKSASIAEEEFLKYSRKIYSKSKELLDAIESAPDNVVEECDISDLYEALIEDIPAIAFAIKSRNQKKVTVNEDMW